MKKKEWNFMNTFMDSATMNPHDFFTKYGHAPTTPKVIGHSPTLRGNAAHRDKDLFGYDLVPKQ